MAMVHLCICDWAIRLDTTGLVILRESERKREKRERERERERERKREREREIDRQRERQRKRERERESLAILTRPRLFGGSPSAFLSASPLSFLPMAR